MPKITLEIPNELLLQLEVWGDRLPELLERSLKTPAIPAQIYQYILNFLVSNPTPEEILAFAPTAEMQERLQTLLELNRSGNLTELEEKELREYEKIEHLIVMLKSGSLPYVKN